MKLVVITDTGEQIEARCDGCRHWKRLRGDEGVCEKLSRGADLAGTSPEWGVPCDFGTSEAFACVYFERKETGNGNQ